MAERANIPSSDEFQSLFQAEGADEDPHNIKIILLSPLPQIPLSFPINTTPPSLSSSCSPPLQAAPAALETSPSGLDDTLEVADIEPLGFAKIAPSVPEQACVTLVEAAEQSALSTPVSCAAEVPISMPSSRLEHTTLIHGPNEPISDQMGSASDLAEDIDSRQCLVEAVIQDQNFLITQNGDEAGNEKSIEAVNEGFPAAKLLSTLENSLKLRRNKAAEAQVAKQVARNEEIRRLFDMPPDEILMEEFNCALLKKVLLQGKLYIFESHLCFFSNLFGYEKVVIPFSTVTQVYRAKTAGVFPNAVELVAGGRKYFWTSFLNREEAYRNIVFGWARKSGHARLYLGEDTPDMDPATSAFALKWESKRRGLESEPPSPSDTEVRVQENSMDEVEADSIGGLETSGKSAARTPPKPPRPEGHLSPMITIQTPPPEATTRRVCSHGRARSDETSKAERLDSLNRDAGAAIAGSAGLLFSTEGREERAAYVSYRSPEAVSLASEYVVVERESGDDSHSQIAEQLDSCGTTQVKAVMQPVGLGTAAGSSSKCLAIDGRASPGTGSQQVDDRAQITVSCTTKEIEAADGSTMGPEILWATGQQREAPAISKSMCKISTTSFQISSRRFFDLFFSEAGSDFLLSFHASRGDQDVVSSEWQRDDSGVYTREINFRHPINFFIGPKATACRQLQRLELFRNEHLVIHTEQSMSDIPYGEHFTVNARWDVEPQEDRQGDACRVSISMEVPFTKKVLLQSAIEKGAINESRQVYQHWIRQAQEVLAAKSEIPPLQQSESPSTVRGVAAEQRPVDEATARILAILGEGKIPEEDAEEIRRMLNLEGPSGSPGGKKSPLSRSSLQSWDGQGAGMRSSGEKFGAGGQRRAWFAVKRSSGWFASIAQSEWRDVGRRMLALGRHNTSILLGAMLLVIICLQSAILYQMVPSSSSNSSSSRSRTGAGFHFAPTSSHLSFTGALFPEGAQPWTPPLQEEAALWWDHRLRQLQENLEYELARVRLHLKEPNNADHDIERDHPKAGENVSPTDRSKDTCPTGWTWRAFFTGNVWS